ncbi:cytochrome b [Cupriavidus plantarum]|uniref:Cytochrome b561 n=1 Tax=Cupriavidus plantarum TaxID=942865 RepID=A0A316EVV0_9BURK|nr:cytochrome b [Cupriavidus plantarum]PWK35289.1 cytochrome b561 [Cupriavidus plantarum]
MTRSSHSVQTAPSSLPLPHDAATQYTRVAILLHWAVALLMIANVVLGLTMSRLPEDAVSGDVLRLLIDTHKSIGITVLALSIVRLVWRVTHRPPPLPNAMRGWERVLAHGVHMGLYTLIFLLPLSGWMHDSAWVAAASHPMSLFGLVPWPRIGPIMQLAPDLRESLHTWLGTFHAACGYALYALLGLHVLGALKHQWIDRHPVLSRMLP